MDLQSGLLVAPHSQKPNSAQTKLPSHVPHKPLENSPPVPRNVLHSHVLRLSHSSYNWILSELSLAEIPRTHAAALYSYVRASNKTKPSEEQKDECMNPRKTPLRRPGRATNHSDGVRVHCSHRTRTDKEDEAPKTHLTERNTLGHFSSAAEAGP